MIHDQDVARTGLDGIRESLLGDGGGTWGLLVHVTLGALWRRPDVAFVVATGRREKGEREREREREGGG